jgi:tetratricopeptide (TPR) repeat protein
MIRIRIIISFLFITIILGLFLLPRGVVDNGGNNLNAKELGKDNLSDSISLSIADAHEEMSDELKVKISAFKVRLEKAGPGESQPIIDSLTAIFKSASQFDSAAIYYERLVPIYNDEEHILKAGELYYEAYSYAMSREMASYLGGKARLYYSMILEDDSTRLDLKNKIAMTFVSSSNPMRGITMLREILQADPENENAIFNMGLLSLQSGQYSRAVEYFKSLVELSPDNMQGQFYLGLCFYELGDEVSAKIQFELVKSMANDPTILATVQDYLNEIN